MKKYFCDGDECKEEITDEISRTTIPGTDQDQKEFCSLNCAQRYMEKMEGKEKMEPIFCSECDKKLSGDYCGLATEIRDNFFRTFLYGYITKFCSVKCMIQWTERERREITVVTNKKEGSISSYCYLNSELGYVGCWQIQEEEKKGIGKFYIKPEIWNELIGN